VAHVIAPENIGGAETVVRRLAEASVNAGINVEVIPIIPSCINSTFVENLSHSNVPVKEINNSKRNYLGEIIKLRSTLIDNNIDILHAHLYHADVISYLAARPIGIPCVSTVHGITGTGLKTALYIWLDTLVLKKYDSVICVSKSLVTRMKNIGCKSQNVHLVQNGYEAPAPISKKEALFELGLPTNKKYIGWVGRISYEKGADLFIDAIAHLNRNDTVGVIVGDGIQKKAIIDKTNKLGLENKIIFIGQHQDASRIFPAFDIFVLSSRSEANPMVILEAFWAKVPTVAFRVGDLDDMIDDSSACIVPSRNTNELAYSINRLLEDKNLSSTLAENAFKKIENEFSVGRWIEKHNRIYQTLLKN